MDCFQSLKSAGINSLLVEGGANIIQSVLESQLADQVVVTVRPCFLGGYRSLTRELTAPLNLESPAAASVGGDIVIFGRLQKRGSLVDVSVGDSGDAVSDESPRSLVEFLE